jgi:hypothetical protein
MSKFKFTRSPVLSLSSPDSPLISPLRPTHPEITCLHFQVFLDPAKLTPKISHHPCLPSSPPLTLHSPTPGGVPWASLARKTARP